jgi:predicted Zn-dependent protease
MPKPLPFLCALALTGCIEVAPAPETSTPPPRAPATSQLDSDTAARNFVAVVAEVEPVAERECRAQAPRLNCDFRIVVDDRPDQPPNAFQTVDKDGRPVIGFTLALIRDARNRDELAFVLGHEAGHHLAGHLARTQQSAAAGALILGALASLGGAQGANVQVAQDIGATVGARRYSKDFELEADRLGTIIAFHAGYDPARGSEFFDRLPDPGNQFLGTHPPNADRRATVLRTLDDLR